MMMETQKERDEYKRRKQFDYLTSDVLKEKKKHTLAHMHYKACGNIIFYVSAGITLAQAVLATLAQSAFKGEQEKMNISIAILAAFSVFWQSLIKHWGHDGNSSMHESAATALGKIYNVALLRARQEKVDKKKVAVNGTKPNDGIESAINKGKSGGKDSSGSTTNVAADGIGIREEEKRTESRPPSAGSGSDSIDGGSGDSGNTQMPYDDLSTRLTKQFEQAIESCTSQVPVKIAAAFELLDNRVGVCKRKVDNPRKSSVNDSQIEWEKVYPTLYRQLTATIIAQRFWPYFNPDPEKVVDLTMKKYLKELESNALLKKLLSRNREIDSQYEKFENGDEIA